MALHGNVVNPKRLSKLIILQNLNEDYGRMINLYERLEIHLYTCKMFKFYDCKCKENSTGCQEPFEKMLNHCKKKYLFCCLH